MSGRVRQPAIPTLLEMARYIAQALRLSPMHPQTPSLERIDALEHGDLLGYFCPDDTPIAPSALPLPKQLELEYLRWHALAWIKEHSEALSWDWLEPLLERYQVSQAPQLHAQVQELAAQRYLGQQHHHPDSLLLSQELERYTQSMNQYTEDRNQVLWKRARILCYWALPCPYKVPAKIPSWVQRNLVEVLPERPKTSRQLSDVWHNGHPTLPVLSNKPSLIIDRASRGPNLWQDSGNMLSYQENTEDGISLQYYRAELEHDQLRKLHAQLDLRTSDVWRLLLAKSLESGVDQVYAPITVDMRELAKAMGYKPHHKGGMKPEHLRAVNIALEHLECFWITITPRANTLEPDLGEYKRKKQQLEHSRQERVLAIMGKDLERTLFGQQYPMRWRIALGEWVRYFPKSYAHIFRSLVELPAKDGVNCWAKQIGTELAYLYRQDRTFLTESNPQRRNLKPIRISTLLERACLLEEVQKMRLRNHHKRAIERFEQVMDLLQEHGVHHGWECDPHQVPNLEQAAGKPGYFEIWLNTIIFIHAPLELLEHLPIERLS